MACVGSAMGRQNTIQKRTNDPENDKLGDRLMVRDQGYIDHQPRSRIDRIVSAILRYLWHRRFQYRRRGLLETYDVTDIQYLIQYIGMYCMYSMSRLDACELARKSKLWCGSEPFLIR